MKHIYSPITALILLLSSVSAPIVTGQIHGDDEYQACPIQMPDLPDQVNIFAYPRNIENTHCKTKSIQWTNLSNASHSDDEYTNLELTNKQYSDCLYFSDFQLNIPQGASIEGVELWVEGHIIGSEISEMKIKLTNQHGKPISASKARTSRQKTWGKGGFGDDSNWSYGGRSDTWSKDWTSEIVNSSGFGVSIQLKQKKDSTHTFVNIDQVRLKVYYTPLPILCNDTSNIFIVEPLSIACTYIWELPVGAYINSANPNLNTITVNIEDLSLGEHEICVRTLTEYGLSDPCCMRFLKSTCHTSSIGNFVWLDKNFNGIQDTNELGMASVTIQLFDATTQKLIDTTITDSIGNYRFDEIVEGHYFLEFMAPTGFEASVRFASTIDLDNDVFEVNNRFLTNPFYMNGLINITNLDAGFNDGSVMNGSIGNYVWMDQDNDGFQDRFEVGMNDVRILLFKSNGRFVSAQLSRSDTLGNQGFYEFKDVAVGEYYLVFEESPDFTYSLPFAKNNRDKDSDVTHKIVRGSTDLFMLKSGMHNLSIDAGLVRVASVGDFIWYDDDADGIQDVNEIGINGLLIELFDKNDQLINSMTTQYDSTSGSNGFYMFEKLAAGGYYIKVEKSNDYDYSPANVGGDDAVDCDINNSNGPGTSFIFNLSAGENERDIDCGMHETVSHNNLVLALSFIDFSLSNTTQGVKLNWKVDNALEIERFVIMRKSITDEKFEIIEELLLSPLMQQNNSFVFVDEMANSGIKYNYYITIQGRNASVKHSEIRSILATSNNVNLSCYPNPVSEIFNINLSDEISSNIEIRMINMSGVVVKLVRLKTAQPKHSIELDVSTLAKGIYILEIEGAGIYEKTSVVVF